jgi:hypothetical protein
MIKIWILYSVTGGRECDNKLDTVECYRKENVIKIWIL